MTDKELLELAAKAIGHSIECDPISGLTFFDSKFSGVLWNPLHNDGDALRLAVSLLQLGHGVHINIYKHAVVARIDPTDSAEPSIDGWCWTKYAAEGAADIYGIDEATRRAIVRAAAKIK